MVIFQRVHELNYKCALIYLKIVYFNDIFARFYVIVPFVHFILCRMAEYEAASEAQYTEEQYPGEDPYEGIEVEGYVEQETTPATNQDNYSQDTTQNNT